MTPIFGFPEIVRFSWSSCSRILEELAVQVDWNDPIAEEESSAKKRTSSTAASSSQTTMTKPKKVRNFLTAFNCSAVSEI
jgi:ribonuclease H2 subunit A